MGDDGVWVGVERVEDIKRVRCVWETLLRGREVVLDRGPEEHHEGPIVEGGRRWRYGKENVMGSGD